MKDISKFTKRELTKFLMASFVWYAKHQEEIEEFLKDPVPLCSPKDAELFHPELWTGGQWKWFEKNKDEKFKSWY